MNESHEVEMLQQRIQELEQQNALLRRDFHHLPQGNSVIVPESMKPLFDLAQQTVGAYFRDLRMDPGKGTIEINDQRYVLVRASTLSIDFLKTIQKLYADRGSAEALAIGKNFLFDISHVIGLNDARNFHAKMNLTDPIAKLSAGPVHFAYAGWAFVDILPESNPVPDDDFYLLYRHPYSFEADSWSRSGQLAETPVCIMNSGYSSGWCEASFGIPLTAVEVTCRGKGDEHCTFVMSPPHRIQEHLDRYREQSDSQYHGQQHYEIPTFFERKKVEEEMQRSRRMAEASAKAKADFVANMSHELRTPLNAILGFAGLMNQTGLDAKQKDYMEAIVNSGNSLLAIINDILDLSKLDAARLVPEKIKFNIQELLHAIQVMLAPKAAEQGLELSCSVDAAIRYSVMGDPMRLRQVLVNLIGNAIKFTQKGYVKVHCALQSQEQDDVAVLFSVKDTGIGIPEEKQAVIFDRFNQGDNNITRNYGGTGLGLAIARQLVTLMGGNIVLKSEPGKGSEFSFVLPFAIAGGEDTVSESPRRKPVLQDGGKRTVLIVEDNLMNQKLARIILHNNGFSTMIANCGSEALKLLRDHVFDAILMDIQMPQMDGCQTTAAIRNELKLSVPIIAMTAYALDSEREQCIREGMNDYLAKPFKEEDLLEKLSLWLPGQDGTQPGMQPLISFSYLKQQTGNNIGFIREMIHLFLVNSPGNIEDLGMALDRKDYAATAKTTHVLRNMINFFGLQHVIGDELRQMEALARKQENIGEISRLFIRVEQVCRQAIAELQHVEKNANYLDHI
jgi:signal transduction histidine kinase/DNA-binding response OmpR family regulator